MSSCALEPMEIDALAAWQAFGLGQPDRQRVTPIEFVIAERGHDEQPLVTPVAHQE